MERQFGIRFAARLAGLLLIVLGMLRPALAADPLVTPEWVAANAGKPGIVFIDLQPPAEYLRGHVPGAVNSSFAKDGWREERADKVPDMFPSDPAKIGQLAGRLGIDNNAHVVLVAPGASSGDMGWATRIYWTFKVVGHDNVSILDGGMAAYAKDKKNRIDQGAVTPQPKSFAVNLRKDMIATMDDVRKARAAGALLVDNRPEDQFVGINYNPKATQSGTLEGAKNLPQQWLTVNGGGQFRKRAQLEQLYKTAGVPADGEQINFCNTGHFASVGWFVSSELMGNKKARLYDGSMVEWTMKGGPVEQKVRLQ